MTYRAIYICDLCGEETPKDKIHGINFSSMTVFRISSPESTQGKHICMRCLDQIHDQTGPRACQCVGHATWIDFSGCPIHGDAQQHNVGQSK